MKPGHQLPVNKTAARVISRGEHHDYKIFEDNIVSDVPLPVRRDLPETPSFKDLTGIKFGRLTVIGYSATHKSRWVCRCTCGNYVMRRGAAIRDGLGAMCEHCYMLQRAKRDDLFRRTGKFVNTEDV